MTHSNQQSNSTEDTRDIETRLRQDLGMLEYEIRDLMPIVDVLYLPRKQVEEAIGEDRPYLKYEPCPHGGGMQYQCHCDTAEESVRSTIRSKLGLNTKDKESHVQD